MQPAIQQKIVNGVNVTGLFETIDAIRDNPKVADFQFRVTNEWLDCGHNRSEIQGFFGATEEDTTRSEPFVLDNDEPQVLLGTDRAANPVEYVLHALAGCLTTSTVYHAAAQGIEIKSLTSSLEGDLDLHGFLGMDPDVRNGYETVRVSMEVDGEATDEEIDRAVETGRDRSPVYEMVSRAVPVELTWRRA